MEAWYVKLRSVHCLQSAVHGVKKGIPRYTWVIYVEIECNISRNVLLRVEHVTQNWQRKVNVSYQRSQYVGCCDWDWLVG